MQGSFLQKQCAYSEGWWDTSCIFYFNAVYERFIVNVGLSMSFFFHGRMNFNSLSFLKFKLVGISHYILWYFMECILYECRRQLAMKEMVWWNMNSIYICMRVNWHTKSVNNKSSAIMLKTIVFMLKFAACNLQYLHLQYFIHRIIY